MTTSKVFVIMTQVLLLCACGASNGGLGEGSSLLVFENEGQCSLANSNVSDQVRFLAEDVCRRTNEVRVAQGLEPVTLELARSQVAQEHSEDMTTRSFFDHTNPDNETPFDRLREAGISYQTAAENIANGQTTAEQVVTAWMNSSGHRANIMNPRFKRLGVGLSGTYWTQVFTD